MFERFTHAARDAVVRAQQEARDLDQSPIGTQHTLLALLADPAGPIAVALKDTVVDAKYVRAEVLRRAGARTGPEVPSPANMDAEDAAALKAIGIDLDAVRKAIEENFGPGSLRLPREVPQKRRNPLSRFYGGKSHIPFSPRNKKVLELSLREAIRLKHNFIAPEHLMLGLLREGNGLGAQILADAGVDFDKLRADVTRSLDTRVA
jgi:ATP-dependent Clp protease ATP-binding subunit ClpA